MHAALHSHQVVLQLGIAVLARPEIKWRGGQFVDQRFGMSIFRKVDALDIGLAGVAALHADVIEVAGGKDGKVAVVFLAASWANDPAKLPLGQAERTDHGSRAAIAHLAQYRSEERRVGKECRSRWS